MHGGGCGGKERKRRNWHMWKSSTRVSAGVSSSSSSSLVNSFYKDGRKISAGDCALFKPPKDCPPFIGIIRCVTVDKENKFKLGVNWLYRPFEVRLGKGLLLESAPNEIFYSFHKDEISATLLLHPCKVAFLPKGVELQSGISSFVCRRVYDIANKCLWWLSDRDYINDCQQVIDKLLYRTCVEMHATVQPGGRSPKLDSSPMSTSQLKSGSDSIQNSVSSFTSQVKGRKRERVDQGPESVKRERSAKNDGDSGHVRQDSILKTQIDKVTEKGGLVDTEGVEKLVQLMIPDGNEKKIDLASRSMLAAVIAATDKFDCLDRFVQLRGLPVFDEWLQEAHKGKIGGGIVSKDGDKSVDEFLLVLLRALDKLPVNLQALQACNIGKSVNHLRTHKNSEIQKKARGLVDTWKKRVEAEMIINDAKAGSVQTVPWPAKQRLPEVAQGGNRHSGGSSDVAMKSSVTQLSASKNASLKIVQGENNTRSASTSASPGSAKSVPSPASATTNLKDGQPHVAAVSGSSDPPVANARDEKSSSSSQSQNNSQSYSSDHVKAGGLSGKEDARSSTAVSMNKVSGGSSRHRKSMNGFPGSTPSREQRETGSSRNSSLQKNSTSEKKSQSGFKEKVLDGTSLEGHIPKLIVKIPNRGRSPAQSASAGSFDDPSIMNSRASSPVLAEKHDQFDRCSKEKNDFYRANVSADINTESWQSNDFKDILTGSDEGDGSPAAIADEEHCRTGDNCKKMLDVSKAASSSSGNESKARNLRNASYSSISALIEGVKYSEPDDVGMNLLASVAAGEISKSESGMPAGSPEKNFTVVEQSCTADGVVKFSEEGPAQDKCYSNDGEHKKQGSISGDLGTDDDNDSGFMASRGESADHNMDINSCSMDLQVTETCLESKGILTEKPAGTSSSGFPKSTIQEGRDGDSSKLLKEKKIVEEVDAVGNLNVKVRDVAGESEAEAIEKSSHPSVEVVRKCDNSATEGLSSSRETTKKSPATHVQIDSVKGTDDNALQSSGDSVDKISDDLNVRQSEKNDDMAVQDHANQSKKHRKESESDAVMVPENGYFCSGVTGLAAEHMEENTGTKEFHDLDCGQIPHTASPSLPSQEIDQGMGPKGSKLAIMGSEEAEECTSTTGDASSVSVAGASDVDAKVEFDLNEGFNADDGKCGELKSDAMPGGCAPAVRLVSPVPFSASSMSSGIFSITVAAAAKGRFVPPEDLLRSKGELGWKGSAATSAFRPAEPRKVMEVPLGTTPIPNAAARKQSRAPLNIDLNVPDERVLNDISSQNCAYQTDCVSHVADGHGPNKSTPSPVSCSGGLGLDLNLVDEASDVGNCTGSNNHKMDAPLLQAKSSGGGPPNKEMSVHRDFDLNNGPVVDEVTTEPLISTQLARSSLPFQPPVSGLRMSNADVGNFSSWFPSNGNTYSAVTISSIMPDRGDKSFSIVGPNGQQRMLGTVTGGNPFSPDIYRGAVLSSPAVPYPSAPFQYPVFPFNSSFPLPPASFSGGSTSYVDSTSGGRLCFPAVNSQLIGPVSTVSSHYPRPNVVGLPDGGNHSSAESSRKWARQGLDLNAGPGSSDLEGRDESSPLVSRQLSVASSLAPAEDQARMFHLGSGVLKRKEPDGGRDGYKQSSWKYQNL